MAKPKPQPLPPLDDPWLTPAEVCQRVCMSKPTLYRHLAAGAFPEPVRFTARIVRWRASAIAAYEASRAGPAVETVPGRGQTAPFQEERRT